MEIQWKDNVKKIGVTVQDDKEHTSNEPNIIVSSGYPGIPLGPGGRTICLMMTIMMVMVGVGVMKNI